MLRFAQHEPRGKSSPWDRYPHIMDPDTALTFAWNMGSIDGWDPQTAGSLYRVTGPNDEEGLWVKSGFQIENYYAVEGSVLWGEDLIPLANALIDAYYSMWFRKWDITPGNLQENPQWVALVRKMEKLIHEAHQGVDFSENPNEMGETFQPHVDEFNEDDEDALLREEDTEVNVGDLRIIHHPNSVDYPQSYHLEIEGGMHVADGDTMAEMIEIVAAMNREQGQVQGWGRTVLFVDQHGQSRDISNLFN